MPTGFSGHAASPAPQWFDPGSVSSAPRLPGIYAWYAVPNAGKPDWQPDIDATGVDLGQQRMADFLALHTRQVQPPAVTANLSWHLWGAWSGPLAEVGSDRLADVLQNYFNPSSATEGGRKLKWALTNAVAREHLAQVLVETAPRLTAPVYIGVATNLSQRLTTHVRTFSKVEAAMAGGTATAEDQSNSFGGRAAAARVRLDDLRVGTLTIPNLGAGMTHTEQRSLAEAVEFVLNRWHRPIFGRR